MKPTITVIMPSYNSESVIERALASIRAQDISDDIEILVVDGGSTDKTRDIAVRYRATVLDNPDRLPEYAKRIGLLAANGEFVVKMDTDEELLSSDQLSKRIELFKGYPDIKVVLADRLLPAKGCGLCCAYLNYCGDPFSLFVYKNTGSVSENFKANLCEDSNDELLLKFFDGDIRPIGDSGTSMFSLSYVNEHFPVQKNSLRFAAATTDFIIQKSGCCGCIRGDNILHHSNATFKSYLSKLRFRVINNLFHKDESGFSSREQSSPALLKRKKLFVLYALSVVGPLFDSIRLAVMHRDATLLLHFIYLYYVCFYTEYCIVSKILGKDFKNKSYGA